MTDKISLAFNDLTADQARALLEAYAAMQAQPQAQPVAMQAQPQAQQQAQPVAMQAQPVAMQAQPQAQPPAPPAGDVDADGVPYNSDLHAAREGASGGKSQDGRWRMKRGAQRDAYKAWHAQHAGKTPAAPTSAAPTSAVPTSAVPIEDVRAQNTVVNGTSPMAPALAIADPGRDAVMAKAGELSRRGLLTQEVVSGIMAKAGTTDNVELVNNPAMRIVAWQEMLRIEAPATQFPMS